MATLFPPAAVNDQNWFTSYLSPIQAKIDQWGVPYHALADKITAVTIPQIVTLGWLLLVTNFSVSTAVLGASAAFVIEPCLLSKSSLLRGWLEVGDQLSDSSAGPTKLELIAGWAFNYREPEMRYLQAQISEAGEGEARAQLRNRMDYLRGVVQQDQSSQKVVIFVATLLFGALFPSIFTTLTALATGILVGDHLLWSCLRPTGEEPGSSPVFGYEALLNTARERVEANAAAQPPESPPTNLSHPSPHPSPPAPTFDYAWTLLSPHLEFILGPIDEACIAWQIPLVRLIKSSTHLLTPTVKLTAWIALMIFSASSWTLPFATATVAGLWFIVDSMSGGLINLANEESSTTVLELGERLFDNRRSTIERELRSIERAKALLESQKASNERSLERLRDASNSGDVRQSVGGNADQAITTGISTCEGENRKIEEALGKYDTRKNYLNTQLATTPQSTTSIEAQAGLFSLAYLSAIFAGQTWLYYGGVSLIAGIQIGNHIYHWANRPLGEGWVDLGREFQNIEE